MSKMGTIRKNLEDDKIKRFSNIRKDSQFPYHKNYNAKCDPVLKIEKRKLKQTEHPIRKPSINMKCFKCKEKKKSRQNDTKKRETSAPLTLKIMRECQERRKKEHDKYFVCKKELVRLPSPLDTMVVPAQQQLDYPSAIKNQKVSPEKKSLPEKWPADPVLADLVTKVPRSGVFINSKTPKEPVDSHYFIYDEKYRDTQPWYEMYRGSDSMSMQIFNPYLIDDIDWNAEALLDLDLGIGEDDEGEADTTENTETPEEVDYQKGFKGVDLIDTDYSTKLDLNTPSTNSELVDDIENEGEGVDVVSAATSAPGDLNMPQPEHLDNENLLPEVVDRILQKFQSSDTKIDVLPEVQRGTLTSHSASMVKKLPEKIYFGVKLGTMHYGDATFSEKSRYRQGLPMCVTAYIYSFIKPPNKWSSADINKVLDMGDKLYLKCLDILHLHENPRILNPEDLYDTCEFGDRKIKYKIDDPDIAGFTRSEDPKVYNLVKGLKLFFTRNRSGILQTYNTNILIWKQKHFYVFDPEPRNEELFNTDDGYACVANLYDLPSIGSMLLNRGKIENWPFIISKITIRNVRPDQSDGDSQTSEFREESLYKIVTPKMAVICGSLSISDPCFGEFKNKQAFAVAVVSLVYNNVTPACCWHQGTVDKIMRVSNQFYIECLRGTGHTALTIDNLPAFFTIGPLMVEVSIAGSLFVGIMYRKQTCLFDELLRKFFYSNTKAIVEIDKCAVAVWRNRDVYYMFDPYSRDASGHSAKNGTSCVTMNTDLDTLIETVLANFPDRHCIFKLHALKMIRVTRDLEFDRFAKKDAHEEFPAKTITVDKTELAIKELAVDEMPDQSFQEIGSLVESLDRKYVPNIDACSPEVLAKLPSKLDKPERIVDLDSPTLSETQVEKEQPRLNKTDSYEFRLIQELFDEDEYEMEEDEDVDYLGILSSEYSTRERKVKRSLKELELSPSEEEEEDYECRKARRQIFNAEEKKDTRTNTELLGLVVMPREILEPNKPPLPEKRPKIREQKHLEDDLKTTQSQELAKTSNFIQLPDGSEILYGSKNIAHLTYDYENAGPFVSAVAIVMEGKYTLTTWTQSVVDAILEYGNALYNSLEIKYSDVPTILIPRLTIGQNSFQVSINFLFDSLLAMDILEQSLSKLVFREWDSAIIVTQNYSCAVFLKRKLYYMYDAFGNNLVGLGEGPDNTGTACMFRFKSLNPLVKRFMCNKRKRELEEPTEASRFLISTVEIKPANLANTTTIVPRREKQLPRIKGDLPRPYFESNPMNVEKQSVGSSNPPTPQIRSRNVVGYQRKAEHFVIEGSSSLTRREEGQGQIRACHFIGVCAMIGIFAKPIRQWDTRRIDYVLDTGNKLFGYVDQFNFADKRNITNLLFDKHFYDVIVKRVTVADDRKVNNFRAALQHLLLKNKYLLLQFPNCCFVLYRGTKVLHLFDPYGLGTDPKACWIKFEDLKKMIGYIFGCLPGKQPFFFYTINISKFKKATRKQKLDYKLRASYVKKKSVPKKAGVCYEDEDWLLVYPIPWSRMKKQLACGKMRGAKSHRWFDWDVEYPQDLYSLTSSLNQSSPDFPRKYRGKQTIANCIVAIIMTEIYSFTDWNTSIMDAILRDGNQYFIDCFKSITAANYEIKVEDFLHTVLVFPYSFKIDLFPLIEGTMYLVKQDQFNISKALQYFFQVYENRCGVVCCTNGTRTKYVAFGRIRNHEYFMYDCSTEGPPMFLDAHHSRAYVLRCLTLNRLIHIITVTLRSGDFFIYHVAISEEQEEQLQQVTYYGSTGTSQGPDEKPGSFQEIDEKMWKDENENF